MKFINKKEQVVDLEITPYGKSLLSLGRFMPTYYAFFDEEVLYDSRFAGFDEQQNSASVRIKDAFNLETQAFFYSAERQVKEATAFHRLNPEEKERARAYGQEPMDITGQPYVQDDDVTIGTISDQEFDGAPLGNSALNSSFAPAWDINVVESQISSSSPTLSGLLLPIPQINMSSSLYEFTLTPDQRGKNFYEFGNGLDDLNPLKNKFLNVIEKSIVLEIDENNTTYEWENFEIEILEAEDAEFDEARPIGQELCTGPDCPKIIKQFLKPLYFKKPISQIQGGVLLPLDEIPVMTIPTDPRYTEYFLSIGVDDEIDDKVLCGKTRNRGDALYGQRSLPCEDKPKQQEINIDELYEPDEKDCD